MIEIKNILFYTLIALVLSIMIGYIVLPMLKKLKVGQMIRDEGPQWHSSKAGTPTMGGVIFIFSTLIIIFSTVLLKINKYEVFEYGDLVIITVTMVSFGVIGYIDDYIKVVKKRNLGFTSKQKLFFQILVATCLAYYSLKSSDTGSIIDIPFTSMSINFKILYIPYIVFFFISVVNAVNFTDGIDGLNSSVTAVISGFFAIFGVIIGNPAITLFGAVLTGSLLGFLKFNFFPAKIFMGDTGSLALGGAVATLAIITNVTLLIPIIGFVYFIEILSVVIQIYYYKKTKKRFFKMSPIHHHFEMNGWSENKIVIIFTTITLILCVGTLILYM